MTRVAWERTSLPIPQVYGVVTLNEETFIYLEDLPGTLFDRALCLQRFSRSHLDTIFANIRHVLHVLQNTRAPPNTPVGGPGGLNLHALARRSDFDEDNIPTIPPPFFPSSAAFASWLHDLFLARRSRSTSIKRQEKKWQKRIASQFDVSSPLVLVHGDFQAFNILIDKEGNITGLIDWEYAGWYPAWVETFPLAVALRQGAGPKTARLAEEVFTVAGVPKDRYHGIVELYGVAREAIYPDSS